MAVVLYSLQEIEEERKGYRKARKLFWHMEIHLHVRWTKFHSITSLLNSWPGPVLSKYWTNNLLTEEM
jgi:hypothetical protein